MSMKAIRVAQFGGPEVMKLETVPVPTPGRGQVLIRVGAIGVNPVDTYWRSGMNPGLQLPFTPGLDAAGEVEAVGEGVTRVKRGQRVYLGGSISGTYAECVLARELQVHPLPDHTSFQEGACLHVPFATAHRALFHRARVFAGETVLVHGASGGVGLAATQLARAFGLRVIGSAGTEAGRALVLEEGAHHVVDHRSPDYLDQVIKLTGGRGVDVVLEMLANQNLGAVLPVLAPQGRVVVIGSRGKVDITPRDLMSRDADVRGMSLFNATDDELKAIHSALYAGLEQKTLRPVVGREMPLEQAVEAHHAIMEPGAQGKIILTT